jgi:hypothetical protein
MTPAKMFDGDLWMLASDAVAMAENAYKKGQTDERDACAKVCDDDKTQAMEWTGNSRPGGRFAAAIRARGQV